MTLSGLKSANSGTPFGIKVLDPIGGVVTVVKADNLAFPLNVALMPDATSPYDQVVAGTDFFYIDP